MPFYLSDKYDQLVDIFGARDVAIEEHGITVDGKFYPVVNDVIILTDPSQYSVYVREQVQAKGRRGASHSAGGQPLKNYAEDIQYTFGEEWKSYHTVLAEHEKEFRQYFGIVELAELKTKRVCDLGCGMGRWSYFLRDQVRELVLVDFSDAIFMARENLKGADNALFFMGDIKRLPFRDDFADFIFCLGVLHHLPTPCLDEVRALRRYAPELLIFLYYALDNRPVYFRLLLAPVSLVRQAVSKIRNQAFRKAFSCAGTYLAYIPLVYLGKLLSPFGLANKVPLYDFYHDKSARRIEQDVYDRFFTRIEQRVSRREIEALSDTFTSITVSDDFPYWNFLCRR